MSVFFLSQRHLLRIMIIECSNLYVSPHRYFNDVLQNFYQKGHFVLGMQGHHFLQTYVRVKVCVLVNNLRDVVDHFIYLCLCFLSLNSGHEDMS